MKSGGICSSLLQQRLIIQGIILSITFPGTIDLYVQFSHQYRQHALSKYSSVDMIQIVEISLVSGRL